ncbi:hypothetical protein SB521682_5338 [Shigella boydii 5216-82]|nr:hypothetical protein SB521682_5338 [Shigella boydii 5216-82]
MQAVPLPVRRVGVMPVQGVVQVMPAAVARTAITAGGVTAGPFFRRSVRDDRRHSRSHQIHGAS